MSPRHITSHTSLYIMPHYVTLNQRMITTLVALRHVRSCHITSQTSLLHHVTSLHTISHHIKSRHIVLHCTAPLCRYRIASHIITSHHVTSYRITSHRVRSHNITSHSIMSHHTPQHTNYIISSTLRQSVLWNFNRSRQHT